MRAGNPDRAMLPPRSLLLPAMGFLAAFYLLPGLLIVLLSLEHPPAFRIDLSLLQLDSYARLFSSGFYMKVLLQTVVLGLVVGVVTAVLGYPAAYFLARSTSRYRNILSFLTLIPMAVGMNMITLGWMIVLGRNGMINATLTTLGIIDQPLRLLFTWGSIVVGLTHVLFTFMVLPIASVLRNIDPALERAARNLGAGPVRAFLNVTLPLSLEGVAAGFLIVFMLSVGALVLPLLLGGQGNMILPVLIWEQFTVAADRSFASALSILLLVMALAALLLQLSLARARRVK